MQACNPSQGPQCACLKSIVKNNLMNCNYEMSPRYIIDNKCLNTWDSVGIKIAILLIYLADTLKSAKHHC